MSKQDTEQNSAQPNDPETDAVTRGSYGILGLLTFINVLNFVDRQLLASFANHVTMAIENATLYTRSDMRLQQQTRRIEALVHSLSDGLILSNLSGKVIYTNPRIEELAESRKQARKAQKEEIDNDDDDDDFDVEVVYAE